MAKVTLSLSLARSLTIAKANTENGLWHKIKMGKVWIRSVSFKPFMKWQIKAFESGAFGQKLYHFTTAICQNRKMLRILFHVAHLSSCHGHHFVNGSSFYVYVKLYCAKPLKSLASDTRLTLTFTTVPFRHIIKTIHSPLLYHVWNCMCEKFSLHQCQFVEFSPI